MRCNMSKATYSCFFQIVDRPLKTRFSGVIIFYFVEKKHTGKVQKPLGSHFEYMPTTRKWMLAYGVKNGKWPKQVHKTNIQLYSHNRGALEWPEQILSVYYLSSMWWSVIWRGKSHFIQPFTLKISSSLTNQPTERGIIERLWSDKEN